jgi:hypothetical protein
MPRKISQQINVVMEVAPKSSACYLRFNKLKVAKTEVLREWPLLAVDRSASGAVVGVESVGGDGFKLLEMLKAAGFKISAASLGNLNLNVTQAETRELATA